MYLDSTYKNHDNSSTFNDDNLNTHFLFLFCFQSSSLFHTTGRQPLNEMNRLRDGEETKVRRQWRTLQVKQSLIMKSHLSSDPRQYTALFFISNSFDCQYLFVSFLQVGDQQRGDDDEELRLLVIQVNSFSKN